jgi:hypothetical protein
MESFEQVYISVAKALRLSYAVDKEEDVKEVV